MIDSYAIRRGLFVSVLVIGSLAAQPSMTWNGSLPGSEQGRAVCMVQDFDGDGRDEVVLGIPGFGAGAGRVACYSGATTLLWTRDGLVGERLGFSLATLNDVNGDGVDEILAGAPLAFGGNGRVVVLDGTSGAVLFTLGPGLPGGQRGFSVVGLGDLTGDGVADFAFGEPLANGGDGVVRIHSGANGGFVRAITGFGGERFGWALAEAGDGNSDGVPDLLVGAPYNGGNGVAAGRFALHSGATGLVLGQRPGVGPYDYLGSSMARLESLPGSADRWVVGAPETALAAGNAGPGFAWICSWNEGGGTFATQRIHTGVADGDRFGIAVVATEGLAEGTQGGYLVAATEDGRFAGIGAGIVVAFASDGTELGRLVGNTPGDSFGLALAGDGDANGDGRPDLLVGAPLADLAGSSSGQVALHDLPIPPGGQRLMISEVRFGGEDAVEITNYASGFVSSAGLGITWTRSDGVVKTATIGPAHVLLPGRRLVVKATAAPFPETLPGAFVEPALVGPDTTTESFTVVLRSESGRFLDGVRVSDVNGVHAVASDGERFRGVAVRGPSDVAVERIEGLDSNSGADWTAETSSSMGLVNRSSGLRGTDPIPVPGALVTEMDFFPDFVEIRNRSGSAQSLRGWYFLAASDPFQPLQVIRPWKQPTTLAGNGYAVVGDGAAPAELPAGVPYVDLGPADGDLPFTADAWSLGLYDDRGRLLDLVRAPDLGQGVIAHRPRVPAPPLAFLGATPRTDVGDGVVVRVPSTVDTDTGADWRAATVRTLGSLNGAGLIGNAGSGDPLDVHLSVNGFQRPSIVFNAGPSRAGFQYGYLISAGHLDNTGPFVGLGDDALTNFLSFGHHPPHSGTLDARGSARIDLDIALPPGLPADMKFFVYDAATGVLHAATLVLELDT